MKYRFKKFKMIIKYIEKKTYLRDSMEFIMLIMWIKNIKCLNFYNRTFTLNS